MTYYCGNWTYVMSFFGAQREAEDGHNVKNNFHTADIHPQKCETYDHERSNEDSPQRVSQVNNS